MVSKWKTKKEKTSEKNCRFSKTAPLNTQKKDHYFINYKQRKKKTKKEIPILLKKYYNNDNIPSNRIFYLFLTK